MSLKNKSLFIFDFDGTLANTLADITASVNYVRNKLNKTTPLEPQEVKEFIGQGQTILVSGITEGSQISEKEALALYQEHHEQHLCDNVSLYTNVLSTLKKLATAGKKLVILTNKYSYYCKQIVNYLLSEVNFDLILGPDNVPAKKPDPSGIIQAINHFGLTKEETIMIGDSIFDLEAGKNAQVTTIGCSYGFGKANDIQALADIVIDDFSEILNLT